MAGMAVAVDVYKVLMEIAKANKELGVTVEESVKGAVAMGGSTGTLALVGGLLGGPLGMIVGGTIGFIGGAGYAAANTKSFKPLHEVLSGMSNEDKRKVVAAAERVIQERGINLAKSIVGRYATELARDFLNDVMAQCKKDFGKGF